jgi:hypothetical protein
MNNPPLRAMLEAWCKDEDAMVQYGAECAVKLLMPVIEAADTLRLECENPAPDLLYRHELRKRIFAALATLRERLDTKGGE